MFDISQLFGSSAVNRLLQPFMTGSPQTFQPQNQLAMAGNGPQPTGQDFPPAPMRGPDLSQPFQMPVDPTQTASAQKPGLMDRYSNFTKSDRGRALNDFFLGLASGSTPNQSLAGAARMVALGREGRKGEQNQNQTVAWLQSQGMDPQQAALVASQPAVLADFLKQRMSGPEQVKPTADIQNYQFATQNGYQGSFADWQKDKGGGVNVNLPGAPNIGTIPPGYAARQNPETGEWSMEPITGGPAAQKAAADDSAASIAKQTSDRNANIVVQDIDRALGMVEKSPRTTTGVGGLVLSNVPGTDAFDTNKLLDTVKANAGFDRLQAMRDASPTGGALGQVSASEMSFLQSAIGNLEQSQGTQQFTDNLKRVKNIYLDIIYGEGQGPSRAQTSFEGGSGNADPLGIR